MSQSKFYKESLSLGRLAGPIIVGQVGQNVITLADTMMVGALGSVALGASAFAGSVFIVFLIFGIGILSPTAALFAKAQGQGQFAFAGVLLKHTLLLSILSSVLIILLLYGLIPLMPYMGQTKEVLEKGLPFYQIVAWTVLPSLIYQGYKQFSDGVGRTKVAMYVMLLGVVVNILGNYVLIYGKWGFPEMGLMGAAMATLFARSLMAVLLAVYIHLSPSFKPYLVTSWKNPLDRPLLKHTLKLGIPNGFTFLFEVGAFSFAAIMMGWFGAGPLAAHQISISLASTTFLVAMSVGIAASIRVGYQLGQGSMSEARYSGFTAIKLGGVYMAICAMGFLLLRKWLPSFYVDDQDVILLAAQFLAIVGIFQVFDGVQAVAIGALRGLSDTQWPSVYAFIAYWIFGLPLGFTLSFYLGFGPIGVWLGLLLGLIFVSTLLTLRFSKLTR